MTIRRRILIVIFCDVLTAGLWYLRCRRLTRPTSRAPWSLIKIIMGSRLFINGTTVMLEICSLLIISSNKRTLNIFVRRMFYCIDFIQFSNQSILIFFYNKLYIC